MKITTRIILALLTSVTLSFPLASFAKDTPDQQTYTQQTTPNEADLKEHGHYVNKSGNVVHSPAHSVSGAVPAGASAQCRDGTYSFSQHHRGTCSHHGGVARWLR
jgi:hypothetical protein